MENNRLRQDRPRTHTHIRTHFYCVSKATYTHTHTHLRQKITHRQYSLSAHFRQETQTHTRGEADRMLLLLFRVNKVLRDGSNCGACLEDIVVYSDNWVSDMTTLREVFKCLTTASLTLRQVLSCLVEDRCVLQMQRSRPLVRQIPGLVIRI